MHRSAEPLLDADATVVRIPFPASAAPGADPDLTVAHGTVIRHAGPPLASAQPTALQAGFSLHEYRIDGVLGQGGFGITYLATDVHLKAKVAIKEYLPEEIAFRTGEHSVSPNASRHQARYRDGLENFLVEARTLASFRHPAIVRVARFFEAHHTAYMVLEYEQGSSFKAWWPGRAAVLGERCEATLIDLLLPLLDGLAAVHAAGFLHRDIKPDNIQRRQSDGSLVLLDFGSAGQTAALGEQGAVIVTPGYAPIEQYGHGEQGPWTDLYALAATLYWAVTGHKPADAETRATHPQALVPALQAGRGRYGEAFLRAIDTTLQPDARRRPRSVAEFRQLLCADHLGSLNLQDALRRGESVASTDGESQFGGSGPAKARGLLHRLRSRQPRLRWRAPRDWPLSVKMSLAMLATALLPMALGGAYNLHGSVAAVERAVLANVQQLAQSTAGRLGQFVADGRHAAVAAATDREFIRFLQQPDEAAKPALRERLRRLVAADPDLQLMMLMDRSGTALVSSDPQVMGRNFRFREYFQQAVAGRAHTTGLVVGTVAGASGMFFAEPVRDDAGAVVGVLVLRILGSSVATILNEVQLDSTLTPLLVDGDGVVVHHPQPALLYSSLTPLPEAVLANLRADQRFRRDTVNSLGETELARALLGTQRSGHVSWRSNVTGVDQIAGFARVPGLDWVVAVMETRENFEAPVHRLYGHMLWSGALLGLLFAGLALRFARSIVRPVQALTHAAHALKAGNHEAARVQVENRDEVGQLAHTFNIMIDVLRQREREREGRRGQPPG